MPLSVSNSFTINQFPKTAFSMSEMLKDLENKEESIMIKEITNEFVIL